MTSNEKQNFENSFSGIDTLGFSAPIKFINNEIGVSIRKDFNEKMASSIKIMILRPSENNIEPLNISIAHGSKTSDGITLRSKVRLSDPIDLYSRKNTGESFFSVHSVYLKNSYFYNKAENKFLKDGQIIDAKDLVQEVFEKHIKTTKPILGLFTRIRLWFWQVAIPILFYALFYNFLHYFLFFISGDRYTYSMYKGRGEINKKSLPGSANRWDSNTMNEKQPKAEEEESEKMDIFGYKLSQHAAVIYSLISIALCLYFYFSYEHPPKVVDFVSGNALLALFYVIVTLHFFDKWLPSILKFFIDSTIKIAYYFAGKPIRV